MEVNISNEVTIKELSEVVNIDGGYAFKSDEFVQNKTPIIRIGNIVDGNVEIDYNIGYDIVGKNFDKYLININDILVAMSGATTGKMAMYRNNNIALLNQRVGRFSVIDKNILDNKYLYYYLRSDFVQRKIKILASGCAQPNISPKQLLSIDIPVPLLETQKKIVEVLEKAEKTLEKRKEANRLLDELVKSQFIEMFGDPSLNPKGWNISYYEDVCKCITDGEHATPKRSENGIYLLSARNILNHSLKLDDVDYIGDDEYERISKRIIPEENDILISCSGSVGRVCKVPQNLKFQMVRSVATLKLNGNINTTFMEWLIDSKYTQQQILQSINQSSQANLFQGKIKKLKAIVPPIELQNQFADFVKQVDKLKFEMQKSLEEMENNFNSLMQRAFKGELFK